MPPAVPHAVRQKDKGERQKLQTTMRRLQFANGLRNRLLTHYQSERAKRRRARAAIQPISAARLSILSAKVNSAIE